MTKQWTHWATTSDVATLRLTAFDEGAHVGGTALGTAQYGKEFCLDPFDAYEHGLISNPNMIVAGSIGTGKSTLVKIMIDRALQRQRRVVVLDPKGEYAALARCHGVRPVAFGKDGWCNPFTGSEPGDKEFLRALLASAQGSPLTSEQHFVLDVTWSQLPTGPHPRLLRALYDVVAPYEVRGDDAQRALSHLLHRFVKGDLSNLFDGEGEPLSFQGTFVVIDLSTQWMSSSLPLALLSAVAAAQHVVASEEQLGYLVLDESWALLEDAAALQWLQGSWKLARSRGLSHTLVLHRWSDVATAGDAGTSQQARAQGLLRECETMWLFRQPRDEARAMSQALGLTPLEEQYLGSTPKGVALVRYGRHRSVVKVQPLESDALFIDTDEAMRR